MPEPCRSPGAKEATVMVMDMAVIHTEKPQRTKVFGEYAQIHLLPFLKKQLSNNTIKGETEGRRTTKVSATINIPKDAE